jgi:hypothetical protein
MDAPCLTGGAFGKDKFPGIGRVNLVEQFVDEGAEFGDVFVVEDGPMGGQAVGDGVL